MPSRFSCCVIVYQIFLLKNQHNAEVENHCHGIERSFPGHFPAKIGSAHCHEYDMLPCHFTRSIQMYHMYGSSHEKKTKMSRINLQRAITLKELALMAYLSIINVHLVDINVFANFYAIPSLPFQDIEKPKRHGRMDGQTTLYPPLRPLTQNTVCRGIIINNEMSWGSLKAVKRQLN